MTSTTTVLIADDTPGIRKLVRRFLEPAGYEVIDARGGQDAMDVATRHGGVDLLVTDLVMPDMDGFDLARLIQETFPAVKVLFTSGYADISWVGPFLPKPFSGAELVAALAALS